ncbi:alanine racemase [Sinomonas sp. B1-1]|uniref:alanine racemase n=1 Tax=Sinomonas sp. B1-1 TaxID=3141454 RepID=UPI003D2C30A7
MTPTVGAAPAMPVTGAVLEAARAAARDAALPAYIYDLAHLRAHLARIRSGLAHAGPRLSLLHAVKANPDAGLVRTIARHVDGLEVASGGELAHVLAVAPGAGLAFGGPGKTDGELAAALDASVDRFHAESLRELRRLDRLARQRGTTADVLLRCNIPLDGSSAGPEGAALVMGGTPSPFGMDPETADQAAALIADLAAIRFVGVHAHLASGLGPTACAATAQSILSWAEAFAARHGLALEEVNVGGGMSVDYARPEATFDWDEYGRLMAQVLDRHPGIRVRIEPGRAVSAYSGWYATRVLDLKRSHGSWFAVCAGGTHHLRTPAAKGHSQPLAVVPAASGRADAEVADEPVTFVGQLCTPKDLLAADVPVESLAVGDLVVFGMAGAYAHNISHTGFLMHPEPTVVHVGE